MGWRIIGLLGCVLTTSNSIATERSVSDIHVVLQDWEFVPTLVGTQVESFLGLRNESSAIGNNITSIWFLRTSDQQWQAYAWHDQDKMKSIAHVKNALQLEDATDAHWPDPNAQLGVDPSLAVEPDVFGTGVFLDDPLLEVIDSLTEPGPFIELLTESGWTAADITIQTDNSICSQDKLLSTLAALVEADTATGAGGALVAGFSISQLECDEWLSLSAPLQADGTWNVRDLTPFLQMLASVDPLEAWQSIVADTVYVGPQTVVIEGGGEDETGQPLVTTNFVITLKDLTPPVIDLQIQGNTTPYPSPGGAHDYYVAASAITIGATATDSIDAAPVVNILHNGQPISAGTIITDVGIHTIAVEAIDSSGNTSSASELFEIRKRMNHGATLYVQDITTVEGINGIEQLSVTALLTADEFDIKTINTTTLNLWLSEEDGTWIKTTGGAPTVVAYEDYTFSLTFYADLSSNPLTILPPDFVVTGRGAIGTSSEYDYYATAPATLASSPFVSPGVDDGADPPPSSSAECEWVVQMCTSPVQSCVWARYPIRNDPTYSVESMTMWVFCTTLTGNGYCWIDNFGVASVSSVCSKTNGGTMHVFLEGEDCCTDCTITVDANPRVSGSGWVNPTGTVMTASGISIFVGGFGASAFGSIWIDNLDGGYKVLNGIQFPISAGTLKASYAATAAPPLSQVFQVCDLSITIATTGTIVTYASSIWLDSYGSAIGNFGPSTPGLDITAQENCGGGGGINVIIH